MKWTILTFGKHKGKTLPQVMFSDPDWFFNGWEKGYFKGWLWNEAEEIYRKSSCIRVPQTGSGQTFVEYMVDPRTGKFATLRTLTGDMGIYRPMTKNMISAVIDMKAPRQIKKYDKTGYRNLLFAMKGIFLGDHHVKMTKRRCEEFFDNPHNFVLPDQEEIKRSGESGVDLGQCRIETKPCEALARLIEALESD